MHIYKNHVCLHKFSLPPSPIFIKCDDCNKCSKQGEHNLKDHKLYSIPGHISNKVKTQLCLLYIQKNWHIGISSWGFRIFTKITHISNHLTLLRPGLF